MQTKYQKLIRPKISVVICNYNYEQYIKDAINSALNQTYQPTEVIVVDDGSTDQSVHIINTYGDKVKLIQKENGGQISAYNEGFKNATGDVVIFLDSDDALMLNALAEISKLFNDDIVKVHYKMAIVDSNGNDLNTILPSTLDSGDCGKDLMQLGLMYKSPPASGNAFRLDALNQLFPLPALPTEKHSADFFCIYGVALLGKVATINEALFQYRVHAKDNNQISFGNALNNYDLFEAAQSRWFVFKNWIETLNIINVNLPTQFTDFTQQKLIFALDIINVDSFNDFVKKSKRHIPWIFNSIQLRKDFNFIKKLCLYLWVLLILICPHQIKLKLARKVCNPIN